MVSKQAGWILANTKVKPNLVAGAWGIPEKECWEYIEDLNIELRIAEKQRVEEKIQQD